ncbi:MAG: hypothetical protein ACFFCS_12750 [Candidatus Hodarchaeota archaeon]
MQKCHWFITENLYFNPGMSVIASDEEFKEWLKKLARLMKDMDEAYERVLQLGDDFEGEVAQRELILPSTGKKIKIPNIVRGYQIAPLSAIIIQREEWIKKVSQKYFPGEKIHDFQDS